MDLHLTCDIRDHVRLFVNGALVAEIAVAQCDTRDTLAEEVQQARALKGLARQVHTLPALFREAGLLPDHTAKTPVEKMDAFMRGWQDGMEGKTIPHPFAGVPPTMPDSTPSYTR